MEQKSVPPYPMSPPEHGSSVFTQWGTLYHNNEVPKNRVVDALRVGNDMFNSYDSIEKMLGAMMIILGDVPEDPLVSVSAAQKGSILGLMTVGLSVNDKTKGHRATTIVRSGKGVIILRLRGDLTAPKHELELFDDWKSYMKYVRPLIDGRNGTIVKGSTLT